MEAFKSYSAYYDLIYRDKDYRGEVSYVRHLIDRYSPSGKSVLELGCGTGRHAVLLQQRGLHVTGVDKSAGMLQLARNRLNGSDLKFLEGDILNFRSNTQYDIVVSLFHVMSYMNGKEDLKAAFTTAFEHLQEGGIFIFDCWHGPAVLNDPPVSRQKKFEDETLEVKRRSYPEWMKEKNLVNVRFEVEILEKQTGNVTCIEELHPMRYWFEDEIAETLGLSGFSLLSAQEWLSGGALSDRSWNACYVARKLSIPK